MNICAFYTYLFVAIRAAKQSVAHCGRRRAGPVSTSSRDDGDSLALRRAAGDIGRLTVGLLFPPPGESRPHHPGRARANLSRESCRSSAVARSCAREARTLLREYLVADFGHRGVLFSPEFRPFFPLARARYPENYEARTLRAKWVGRARGAISLP